MPSGVQTEQWGMEEAQVGQEVALARKKPGSQPMQVALEVQWRQLVLMPAQEVQALVST